MLACAARRDFDLDQLRGESGFVPGCAQLHQQLIARELVALQSRQPIDVAAQALASHAALLIDACIALREHLDVRLGGQPLDVAPELRVEKVGLTAIVTQRTPENLAYVGLRQLGPEFDVLGPLVAGEILVAMLADHVLGECRIFLHHEQLRHLA